MTASSFEAALARVLAHEGGYSDHPADPGGPTNLGVTQATLSAWLGRPASVAEVRALTPARVAPLYRRAYWDRAAGDELPAGLAYAVFDFAVNSGPARAVMALQRLVGVADDGVPGPLTLRAAAGRDEAALIGGLCAARLAFLRQLSTWPTFGAGWARRVAEVRTAALAMAADRQRDPARRRGCGASDRRWTMTKFLTPGVVTGILSAASVGASLVGRPALAAYLNDPATAANLLALVGAAGALAAGFLKGVRSA